MAEQITASWGCRGCWAVTPATRPCHQLCCCLRGPGPLFPQESLLSPIDRRSDFYRHAALELPHKAETPQPLLTIPNVLTFFRLLLVPVLVVLWESGWRYAPISCGIVFAAASITDYFDGYLARKVRSRSAWLENGALGVQALGGGRCGRCGRGPGWEVGRAVHGTPHCAGLRAGGGGAEGLDRNLGPHARGRCGDACSTPLAT